jgi:hypothetical protein
VTLSSALIERIFDGIWLIVCLLITLGFVTVPRYIVEGGLVLGLVVICCAALLAGAMFFKARARRLFAKNRVLSNLNVLLDDLHIIGHSKFLYFSAFASLPYLLMQIIPIYAVARAYPGFDISIGQAAALMVILRLGSVVPQAPGNVGIFQALTVMGLGLFAITGGAAKRFSLILWSVVTLPLLIAGFIALAITGLKIGTLRSEAAKSMAAPAHPQP